MEIRANGPAVARRPVFNDRPCSEIYHYLLAFRAENYGRSPTLREIADGTNIGSSTTVHYHLRHLIADGLVLRVGAPRAARANVEINMFSKDEAGQLELDLLAA